MAGKGAPISPERAKAILESLPGRKSLAALRRALVARGTPVSAFTLRRWKANQWSLKRKSSAKPPIMQEVRAAAERVGLPANVISGMEARLQAMTDNGLVTNVTRSLLVNAAVLLAHAWRMAPELMKTDPRGLAGLYLAANNMTTGAYDLMTETRNLAERAKCALLPPILPDADRAPSVTATATMTDRLPTAGRSSTGSPGSTL